jgi:hypothetical protein
MNASDADFPALFAFRVLYRCCAFVAAMRSAFLPQLNSTPPVVTSQASTHKYVYMIRPRAVFAMPGPGPDSRLRSGSFTRCSWRDMHYGLSVSPGIKESRKELKGDARIE